MLTHLIGFGAVLDGAPVVTWADAQGDETDRSGAYTFATVNLGSYLGTKRVIVGVQTVTQAPGAVVIAGVTATQVLLSAQSAFYIAAVPVGTTSGTITVTPATGTAARCMITVYEALNLTSATPYTTTSDTGASPHDVSLTLSGAPSVVIGMVYNNVVGATYAWTAGLNEDFDGTLSTTNLGSGSINTTQKDAFTITATYSGANTGAIAISAAWG
jgi:hypothetical protein